MSLEKRIARLERAAGAAGDVPVSVVFVSRSGRSVPQECESALLALDQAARPDVVGVRYVDCFDVNGLCLNCGGQHEAE